MLIKVVVRFTLMAARRLLVLFRLMNLRELNPMSFMIGMIGLGLVKLLRPLSCLKIELFWYGYPLAFR